MIHWKRNNIKLEIYRKNPKVTKKCVYNKYSQKQLSAGPIWGGVVPPPPSGIRPHADLKGPPFILFRDIHFWLTDPKIFIRAPLAPRYIFSRGSERRKMGFFGQNFPKRAQKRLFSAFFYSKFSLRRRNFDINRIFTVLCESSEKKSIRSILQKRSKKFWNFFLNPSPLPLEKILVRHPPLTKGARVGGNYDKVQFFSS